MSYIPTASDFDDVPSTSKGYTPSLSDYKEFDADIAKSSQKQTAQPTLSGAVQQITQSSSTVSTNLFILKGFSFLYVIFSILVFLYVLSKVNNTYVANRPINKSMAVKKIIAREGLLIVCILFLLIMSSEIGLDYYIGYIFFIYPVYLIMRFIGWSIKTLKSKAI